MSQQDNHSISHTDADTAAGGESVPTPHIIPSTPPPLPVVIVDPKKRELHYSKNRPGGYQTAPGANTPIRELNINDVLCGRGSGTNHYPGNIRYRTLVRLHQDLYSRAGRKDEKTRLSHAIVTAIRNAEPSGRFLKRDEAVEDVWLDIGDRKACEKTSQTLREGVAEQRMEMGHDGAAAGVPSYFLPSYLHSAYPEEHQQFPSLHPMHSVHPGISELNQMQELQWQHQQAAQQAHFYGHTFQDRMHDFMGYDASALGLRQELSASPLAALREGAVMPMHGVNAAALPNSLSRMTQMDWDYMQQAPRYLQSNFDDFDALNPAIKRARADQSAMGLSMGTAVDLSHQQASLQHEKNSSLSAHQRAHSDQNHSQGDDVEEVPCKINGAASSSKKAMKRSSRSTSPKSDKNDVSDQHRSKKVKTKKAVKEGDEDASLTNHKSKEKTAGSSEKKKNQKMQSNKNESSSLPKQKQMGRNNGSYPLRSLAKKKRASSPTPSKTPATIDLSGSGSLTPEGDRSYSPQVTTADGMGKGIPSISLSEKLSSLAKHEKDEVSNRLKPSSAMLRMAVEGGDKYSSVQRKAKEQATSDKVAFRTSMDAPSSMKEIQNEIAKRKEEIAKASSTHMDKPSTNEKVIKEQFSPNIHPAISEERFQSQSSLLNGGVNGVDEKSIILAQKEQLVMKDSSFLNEDSSLLEELSKWNNVPSASTVKTLRTCLLGTCLEPHRSQGDTADGLNV